jgi:hypothetical protein
MEFSKKILIVAAVLNVLIIVFTFVMVWRTNDLTPLQYLIPAIAAETATGTGYYYSKAKVENRIKLMKRYNIDATERIFNDTGGHEHG